MVVAHRVGSLCEGISCRESVVLAVEIGETGGDPYALSIEPWTLSDSITRRWRVSGNGRLPQLSHPNWLHRRFPHS